jgi:hypothetical protein
MRDLFRLGRAKGLASVLGILGLVLATVSPAAQLPEATVDFAPAVAASLHDRYGEDETAVLRSAIVTAVARETQKVTVPSGLTVTVTVRDIAPTRPTLHQLSTDPAMDVERTRFIGGADLAGVVRDAHGHLVVNVMYRYYPPTLEMGSVVRDAWADARRAIDQFAVKLAAACRRISGSPAG